MIVVDSREPRSVTNYLTKHGIKYKLEMLNYGDYLIMGDKNIVIERKDIFDFWNSVQSGRMWKQLIGIELYGDSYHKVLLIEGNVAKVIALRKSVNFVRWIGAISSIISKWNVSVILVPSFEASMLLIEKLNKKVMLENEENIHIPTVPKQYRGKDEESFSMIMAISGFGYKKTKKLFDEFKSVSGIIEAGEERVGKVVGRKLATHLFEIIKRDVE